MKTGVSRGTSLVGLYLAILGFETNHYAKVWKDPSTLWGDVIRWSPDNWAAYTFLGQWRISDSGNPMQAAEEFKKSLELQTDVC